jgi:hypothetical protein
MYHSAAQVLGASYDPRSRGPHLAELKLGRSSPAEPGRCPHLATLKRRITSPAEPERDNPDGCEDY